MTALMLATWLSPAAALAQQPGGSPEARAAFERGMAALNAHQYQAAVREFETSYRLRPFPVVLYNLALAHRELGHVSAALSNFERYLAEGGDSLPPERVAAVRDAERNLRAQLATVRLTVTPRPFMLSVDGRDAAVTNRAVTLDPGDHVLVVTAQGHRAWREELRLTAGQRVERAVTLTQELAVGGATAARAAWAGVAPPNAATSSTTPHPREGGERAASPPITSRWWFWTGLAVVVIGGVVTGVWLANENAVAEPLLPGTAFNVGTIRLP